MNPKEYVRIMAQHLSSHAITNPADVLASCEKHLTANPDNVLALWRRAYTLLFLGREAEAQRDLDHAGNAGFVALTFAGLSTLAQKAWFPSVLLFSVLADFLSGFLSRLLWGFVLRFFRSQETQTVSFAFLARDWPRCFPGLGSVAVGGAGSRSGPRKQNARAAVDATARAAPPGSYLPWDNSSISRRPVSASFRSGFACERSVAKHSFRFDTTSGIAPIPPVVSSSAAGKR